MGFSKCLPESGRPWLLRAMWSRRNPEAQRDRHPWHSVATGGGYGKKQSCLGDGYSDQRAAGGNGRTRCHIEREQFAAARRCRGKESWYSSRSQDRGEQQRLRLEPFQNAG